MKNKKGFSLAEILIAIAIVSIIATLGFGIAKKNLEKAYDLFYYTGYKGLLDAIILTKADDVGFERNDNLSKIEFFTHIAVDALDGVIINTEDDVFEFTAPNKITYTIIEWLPKENWGDTNLNDAYLISMKIPSRKVRANNNTRNSVYLVYFPNDLSPAADLPVDTLEGATYNNLSNILIPVGNDLIVSDDLRTKLGGSSSFANTQQVQNRIDLFPFYLNNDNVGRVIIDPDTSQPVYIPYNMDSITQKYCQLYGSNLNVSNTASPTGLSVVINCAGIAKNDAVATHVLQLGDPRKVRL